MILGGETRLYREEGGARVKLPLGLGSSRDLQPSQQAWSTALPLLRTMELDSSRRGWELKKLCHGFQCEVK